MSPNVSPRVDEFVLALPLRSGLRVLEIGCGPGVAAREVLRRLGKGYVLAIDRSKRAVALAIKGAADEIATGMLEFRCVAAEEFRLRPDDDRFDLAFAMRVGALDGRHPELEGRVLQNLKSALKPNGRLFIDGGSPLREISLH
ncbi:MAG: class I SAM-dependent methyltransferase [Usitatibacteraceae bacterium]